MEVRPARLADAEAIRAIYNGEVTTSLLLFEMVARSLEEQQQWIEQHSGAHPALVAVEGSDVLGFASLTAYRERPAYATTVEDSVYVRSDQRGRGVGRLLLSAAVDAARAHGFHSVIGRIVATNDASIRLHRACGFELIGIEREVGRKFGQWLDVAVMQLLLDPSRPSMASTDVPAAP